MHDSTNITATCDEQAVVSEEQILAARHIVAGNSDNLEDAIDLMMMLGLHPDQQKDVTNSALPTLLSTSPRFNSRCI